MDLNTHGTQDQLELYVLGRLKDPETAELEEHLLFCDPCRTQLEEIAAFAPAMREELSRPPVEKKAWFALPHFSAFAMPRLAMAGAFAAVVLAFGAYWMGGRTLAPVASLTLMAARDYTEPSVGSARELDITIMNAPRTGGPFTMQLVDASGGEIWTGAAGDAGPVMNVKIARRLSPGEYLVRLNGASGRLANEYRFVVKN